MLARHGSVALAYRWFGGPGQPPGICEVPLESFGPALDLLRSQRCRLSVVGVSKGAEAALLLATRFPDIELVAALSPSSVVWANVGPGLDGLERPMRSSFLAEGRPVPFVPYDDAWAVAHPSDGSHIALYERSLHAYQRQALEAAIPVEASKGHVLVASGGDDRVWPSAKFARDIVDRRTRHGGQTTWLHEVDAGHRPVLPGETPPADDGRLLRGGNDVADRALGTEVWHALVELLGLDETA